MKNLKRAKITWVLALFLWVPQIKAQSYPVDTLAQARELRANGKLNKTEKLLNLWCLHHPNDASAFWLRAQNESWRKNLRSSRRYYRMAIALEPKNRYLKLDFAEAQLDVGRFSKTERWLSKLPKEDRNDPHYQYVLAKLRFWAGDLASAKTLLESAQKSGSKKAPALLKEIELARSPWVKIGANYGMDTQPLARLEPMVEAGLHYSKWLDIGLRASIQYFDHDSFATSNTQFELSNGFRFPKSGMEVRPTVGVFQLKGQQPKFTAQIAIRQRLPAGWQLTLLSARKPYLNTLSSLDTSIIYHQLLADIEWREPHGFSASAGAEANTFEDKNQIATYWAWALSPPLKIRYIQARLGYVFSFSDSGNNQFSAEKTLAQILSPWDSTATIRGVYSPYFTPEKMAIHAFLASLECALSKKVTFAINGKYGFYATANNPYLYLDKDLNDAVYIAQAFLKTSFTPFETGAKLAIQFNTHWSAEVHYSFVRNFFYEIQHAGTKLKLIF